MDESGDLPLTERIKRYRRLADEAEAYAQRAKNREAIEDMRAIADSWRKLADDVEATDRALRVHRWRDPFSARR